MSRELLTQHGPVARVDQRSDHLSRRRIGRVVVHHQAARLEVEFALLDALHTLQSSVNTDRAPDASVESIDLQDDPRRLFRRRLVARQAQRARQHRGHRQRDPERAAGTRLGSVAALPAVFGVSVFHFKSSVRSRGAIVTGHKARERSAIGAQRREGAS